MDEHSVEAATALQAVKTASVLCRKVGRDLAGTDLLLKGDRSPVTIADFGSQAIISMMIRERFPGDTLVAEEDSKDLRKPNNSRTLEQVTRYVRERFPEADSDKVCSWIDISSTSLSDRFWTLDPIDGTKGFLRGDPYAIALALVEKGRVQLGLLGCPNLYSQEDPVRTKKGCLFMAVRGKGAIQMDLNGESRQTLSVSKVADPSDALFTESFESDHADHQTHKRLAERLNMTKPSLRMDSQAKYGVVARGEAVLYLRVPSLSDPGYREKIWDHAAGSIITEEAGGRVTDLLGRPLDFSHGITMEKNLGILASNGILHEVVLKALNLEKRRI
jgi:3'(2'), 5'-bisphosphate nucleotidase